MHQRKRRDALQAEIIEVLRKLGCSVLDLSQAGGGCPDLLISKTSFNGSSCWTVLAEIKAPKAKLRAGQAAFVEAWQGRIYILRSVEDAIKIVEREKVAWMPAVKTLLDAIAELESAAEDCGYYCEPPDNTNLRLADARCRRHKASQRIEVWIQKGGQDELS